jgi:hypothetical protein
VAKGNALYARKSGRFAAMMTFRRSHIECGPPAAPGKARRGAKCLQGRGYNRISPGGVPEWPKGTGCKPVGSAYGGSNPPAPIQTGLFHEQFHTGLASLPVRATGRHQMRARHVSSGATRSRSTTTTNFSGAGCPANKRCVSFTAPGSAMRTATSAPKTPILRQNPDAGGDTSLKSSPPPAHRCQFESRC